MQVTVQVSADVAPALQQGSPATQKSADLLKLVESLGLKLEPMHPDTPDFNLQKYFIVQVADEATAQQVLKRLQQSPVVEAAYVKPPDQLA